MTTALRQDSSAWSVQGAWGRHVWTGLLPAAIGQSRAACLSGCVVLILALGFPEEAGP